MSDIEESALASALSRACSEAANTEHANLMSVASALRGAAGGEDDPIRALVAALEYHLVADPESRPSNLPFGALIEGGGRSYPAPLDKVEEIAPGTYALWDRALRLSPLALVRARFADLLWAAKYGDRPHEFAREAIDAYVESSSEGFGHAVELTEAIRRAIEVASEINDPERRSTAVTAGVRLVKLALDSDEPMPGVALPLLEVFVRDRPSRRPPELSELLDEAVTRFGNDPWSLESTLDLQAQLAPPESRDALRERAAEAFRELAHDSEGLVKYAHLQHAIEIAEQYGLRSLADEIRREVEGISEEELNLTTISAEVSVPRAKVDAYVGNFVGDDNLEAALTRFGSRIPSGDPEETRRQVQQYMSQHPLQFLVTRITIGPENSLIRSTTNDDDQAEQAMVDHEARSSSIFSLFAVEILERMREQYGSIAAAVEFFESELIEKAVASKICHAIKLYEDGDYDSAAAVLAPRLERIVRRVAAAVGLTVTRSPDRRGRSGGVKGLGELLGTLEGGLPEATRRYLRVLLSEVTGLNLRNRVSHGLDDEITQREAALLIHAACHLALLTPAR